MLARLEWCLKYILFLFAELIYKLGTREMHKLLWYYFRTRSLINKVSHKIINTRKRRKLWKDYFRLWTCWPHSCIKQEWLRQISGLAEFSKFSKFSNFPKAICCCMPSEGFKSANFSRSDLHQDKGQENSPLLSQHTSATSTSILSSRLVRYVH